MRQFQNIPFWTVSAPAGRNESASGASPPGNPGGKGELSQPVIEGADPFRRLTNHDSPPMASVIIRTMDRPEMLKEALRSVAAQTWPNIEMLVINDGGENVEDIVMGFKGDVSHVRYIHLATNQGRSIAANIGLERAGGEYIILLDDDDYFYPGHITMLMNALEEAGPGVGVAYAGVECIKNEAPAGEKPGYVFKDPYDPLRLLTENYIPMHAALFWSRLLDSGACFDESMGTFEDWDFWVQLSRITQFKFVDEVGAVYRIYEEGGFGVGGDEDRIREARAAFFEKWHHLWTTEQLIQIIDSYKYRRRYDDLSKRYATRVEHLQAVEKQVEEHTRTNAALLERLNSQDTEITEQAVVIYEQTGSLEEERQKSLALMERILELENSTSWRITRPVRRVSIFAQGLSQKLLSISRRIQRYLSLSIQILSTEGVGRYIERVGKKLAGRQDERKKADATEPGRPEMETSWGPLRFTTHKEPEFSIIIPVHNKHLYTYTCLKSLAADNDPAAFEIIVVDDHSVDETGEMLAAMDGVRVVNNQGERGFIHACNLGAKHAGGK
ncbi:MAG: glycosyltransferase, partial [Desulfobacterales bacterium]|nr:glycosyltransferase [Desulfobacterales bacterium]